MIEIPIIQDVNDSHFERDRHPTHCLRIWLIVLTITVVGAVIVTKPDPRLQNFVLLTRHQNDRPEHPLEHPIQVQSDTDVKVYITGVKLQVNDVSGKKIFKTRANRVGYLSKQLMQGKPHGYAGVYTSKKLNNANADNNFIGLFSEETIGGKRVNPKLCAHYTIVKRIIKMPHTTKLHPRTGKLPVAFYQLEPGKAHITVWKSNVDCKTNGNTVRVYESLVYETGSTVNDGCKETSSSLPVCSGANFEAFRNQLAAIATSNKALVKNWYENLGYLDFGATSS